MKIMARLWLAFLRTVAWFCERMGRVRYIPERPVCEDCRGFGIWKGARLYPTTCRLCRGTGHVPHSEPYLTRYVLWGRVHDDPGPWLVNVWLHRIYRPDADRDPHDHPWVNAGGVVLAGGYKEIRKQHAERLAATGSRLHNFGRALRAGSVTLLPRGVYHRIARVLPNTWTLFVTGREHGAGWGFLVDGVHVDSKSYLKGA